MDELLQSISSTELTQWIAYYSIEPFGPAREDDRAGVVAATMANCHTGKSRKSYKPNDFFPRKKARQTVEQMIALLKTLG